MTPMSICIVARYMSRPTERARVVNVLRVVLMTSVVVGALSSVGCEQVKARNDVRTGNKLFAATKFIDAAAFYERALKVVDHPRIHYNLGLTYSKIFKAGFDGPILLGTADDPVCQLIPGVQIIDSSACVRAGDRRFPQCGPDVSAPIEKRIAELNAQAKAETDEVRKRETELMVREQQDELNRFTCSSSFSCVQGKFCSLTSPKLADLAATHMSDWIKAQPSDDALKAAVAGAQKRLEEAKKLTDPSKTNAILKEIEELNAKDQTRNLMTGIWIDSAQFQKAIEYWEGLLAQRPNDPSIIGTLGGIHLKAGNWRQSIEWYAKLAEVSAEPSNKVAAYLFIGNVAWAKLNSKTLIGAEVIEIADRAIQALQRGAEIQPKNVRLWGLQGSILSFRSAAHGASWASAIDRASGQELVKAARVLAEEAKKAEEAAKKASGQPTGAPAPAAPAPAPATPPAPTQSGSGTAPGTEKSGG